MKKIKSPVRDCFWLMLTVSALFLLAATVANGQTFITVNQPPLPAKPLPAPPPEKQPEPLPDRLVVFGYSPTSFACPHCDTAKRWKDLPFDVEWKKAEGMKYYPAFQFPNKSGGWRRFYGADRKRLVEEWTLYAQSDNDKYRAKTHPTKEAELAVLDPVQTVEPLREVVCGCAGSKPGCCLCLEEIRTGRRTKPCGCSAQKGSVHLVQGYLPNRVSLKATGEYRFLRVR